MVSDSDKVEDFENLEDDGDVEELPAVGEESEEQSETEGLQAAPEMKFSKENQEAEEETEQVMVKYCMFCRELIPFEASACKHCGSTLNIYEGKVFKQYYVFLWGAIMVFIGSFLPWFHEGALVTANTTFCGAVFMVISLLLIAAMGLSIIGKKGVYSPIFLMFLPAIHTWLTVVERVGATEAYEWYTFLFKLKALEFLAADAGSGTVLVLIGSTLVTLTFIIGFISIFFSSPEKTAKPQRGARRR